jgi:outer membrane protein TolC
MNRIRMRFLPVALAAVTLFAAVQSAFAQDTATKTIAQPLAAPQPGEGGLTLDEAIAIAINNNRDITSAAHSVANADLAIETAKSYRLPQFSVEMLSGQSLTEVGVDFPAGAFGVFEGLGPVPAVNTTVTSPRRPMVFAQASVAQPITQLIKTNLNVKATAIGRDIEQERRRQTIQTTAANVRKAYYALLQVDASLRAAETVLDASRALDTVVGERVVQRVALKGDGLQSQLHVAEAVQERLTLQNTRAEREEQFNLLLGRDPSTPVVVVPVPIVDPSKIDLQTVIAEAVERRADVRAARLRVDQAELQQRVTNAGRIPEVSVALSYQSFFNTDLLPRNQTSVGLQVKWEPWDWGRRQREARERGNDIEQAKLSLRQLEDKVRIEVAKSYRDIQQARGQVLLARASQEVAHDHVRVTTERIKVAAALPVDGLSADRELAESAAREQDALSGYWAARAAYEQAIGEDVR